MDWSLYLVGSGVSILLSVFFALFNFIFNGTIYRDNLKKVGLHQSFWTGATTTYEQSVAGSLVSVFFFSLLSWMAVFLYALAFAYNVFQILNRALNAPRIMKELKYILSSNSALTPEDVWFLMYKATCEMLGQTPNVSDILNDLQVLESRNASVNQVKLINKYIKNFKFTEEELAKLEIVKYQQGEDAA